MKFQTILAGFIAQRGAAANGAVKLRLKQPEPAVFTESYSCHFFTPDIKSFSLEANALVLLVLILRNSPSFRLLLLITF